MRCKLSIVTGPLAPYRLSIYQQIANRMGGEVQILFGQTKQLDHQWTNLVQQNQFLSMKLVPGSYLPAWIRFILRVLKMGKGNPMMGNWRIYSELKKLDPEIVWLCEHSIYSMPALLYARVHGKICVVATDIGKSTLPGNAGMFVQIVNALGNYAVDGVIACSPHALEPLFGPRKPVVYAPHAVRAVEYEEYIANHGEPEKTVRLLYVGNCLHLKGLDLLLSAMEQLKGQAQPFELRVVGGGDTAWLTSLAEKLGVDDLLNIVGFKEGTALKEEYSKADVFVFPSRNDTYGVVVHEAACCALPLLVSQYAGASQVLVEEGVNGHVIDPYNVKAFAQRLRELIDSPDMRREYGKVSLRLAKSWDVDRSAQRIVDELNGYRAAKY